MHIPKSIRENLRFLIIEVSSQVGNLQTYFETHSVTVARRILDRSGYTNNLKTSIHSSCLSRISRVKCVQNEASLLRSLETIATDLVRITELCRDCIQQVGYLDDTGHLPSKLYIALLGRVDKGINMIDVAIDKGDTRLALRIGCIEKKLDCAYEKLLKKHTRDLKLQKKKHTEDLVAALFVAHSIEQMGDVLLNISEAIISANLGQPFNTERYHSLQASVEQLSGIDNGSGLALESVAQTRSGSGISGLSTTDQEGNEHLAIFKDGQKRKVKEERQGVENWHEIFPGLAPKILSYHKHGQSAALLIEHLAGLTFEQILLHEPAKLLDQTMKQLQKTLESVWNETCTKKSVSANYMEQLEKRLELLRVAEQAGVRVFSPALSMLRLIDRLSCTVTLRNAGIPMPDTRVTEDIGVAMDTVRDFGSAVFKPLYSTKARGMTIIDSDQDSKNMERAIHDFSMDNQMMYIQRKINLPGRDLGMVFLAGSYLGTYARVPQGDAWNTTINSGGRYEAHTPSDDVIELAHRAQAPFNMDFTTVDVAETDTGPIVFEVSAFGGFQGAKDGIGIDAAALYVDYVMQEIQS